MKEQLRDCVYLCVACISLVFAQEQLSVCVALLATLTASHYGAGSHNGEQAARLSINIK